MKAEIHVDPSLVEAGEARCISLRVHKKYARVKTVATVMLSNVEFVGPHGAVGTLTGEFLDEVSMADMEIPQSLKDRFVEVPYDKVTVETAKALVAVGGNYFVLPS